MRSVCEGPAGQGEPPAGKSFPSHSGSSSVSLRHGSWHLPATQARRKWKVKVKSLSPVWLFATPWAVAYEVPPSMEFSRQEYWSGLPFPSPRDLPDPGTESGSSALQVDAFTVWTTRQLRQEEGTLKRNPARKIPGLLRSWPGGKKWERRGGLGGCLATSHSETIGITLTSPWFLCLTWGNWSPQIPQTLPKSQI